MTSRLAKRMIVTAAAVLLLSAQASTVSADTILTFGPTAAGSIQAIQSGSSTTIETAGGHAVPVTITLLNGTTTTAYFNLNALSAGAALAVGPVISQLFNGSFEITQNSNGTGTDYLSGKFTGLTLGISGVTVSLFAGNPTTSLSLTSSVFPKLGAPSSAIFTFSNVSPALKVVGSGSKATIGSFTASASAVFTASVPEPSSLVFAGVGALGMIGYGLRRRKPRGD